MTAWKVIVSLSVGLTGVHVRLLIHRLAHGMFGRTWVSVLLVSSCSYTALAASAVTSTEWVPACSTTDSCTSTLWPLAKTSS